MHFRPANKTPDKHSFAVLSIELNSCKIFNELEIPGTCEASKAIAVFSHYTTPNQPFTHSQLQKSETIGSDVPIYICGKILFTKKKTTNTYLFETTGTAIIESNST